MSWNRCKTHPLAATRGTSGTPRHTRLTRYRCSLPGLAGFAGNRCTEPEVPPIVGLRRNFSCDTTASRSLAYRSAPRKKMAASEIRRLSDRVSPDQRMQIARRRSSLAGVMAPYFIALGVIWYIVFLFSTTCHEGAHSLVARLGGDPSAFHGGQASLNPLPHIRRSPFGMVVVPILTYILPPHWMFGWASAPYDPAWQRQYPRRAAWMALAGPAANFTLAILAAVGIRAGMALGYLRMPESVGFTHIAEATGPGAPQFAATFLSGL